MTKGKLKATRRAFALFLSIAMATSFGMPTGSVYADSPETTFDITKDDSYSLKWSDEFDGTELSDAWNVEAHDPGWVNAELQRYVSKDDMQDNIKLEDGELKIYPTVEKKATGGGPVDVLDGNGFAGWKGNEKLTVTSTKEKGTVVVDDAGDNPWDAQYQITGLTLEKGHDYRFSVKAKSDKERTIQLNVTENASNEWPAFAQQSYSVTTEEQTFTTDFTMKGDYKDIVCIQLNFGKFKEDDPDNELATVELTEVSLVDLTAAAAGSDVFSLKNYNFTSGRVNTQGNEDFIYGYFEAKARVPKGMGYLPAFWLMATDESEYGAWPKCGEIDIMEVMGQDTTKSYHTIHYGYNTTDGHKQQQKEYVSTDPDFYTEEHVYGLEWLPGKLTWYVDGKEVFTTDNWVTGNDESTQLILQILKTLYLI